jgi:hypothetical protein
VNGQIEVLTRYGKVDLIWFDGTPAVGNQPIILQERIRELQPGILINPRLHGHGDFVTYERNLGGRTGYSAARHAEEIFPRDIAARVWFSGGKDP